ncbi:hypothetical protein B0H14DRAFT_57837 [Mycena olivaceomarginata]|nr:hypothetical protein B0H14DRAFT_57837 [Mycena olivaceomarginata]
MEQQHLLCERLQALLTLHGRHLRVSSSTRMSTGVIPPTYAPSVLSTPVPSAPCASLPPPGAHAPARAGAPVRLWRCPRRAVAGPSGGQEADACGDEEDVGATGIGAQCGELAPAPWLYAGDRGRASFANPRLRLVAVSSSASITMDPRTSH